jgi:hypothetical protein
MPGESGHSAGGTDKIGEMEVSANSSITGALARPTSPAPSLIQEPFVEDIPAGEERPNHSMGFTLGGDTGGATTKITLTNTSDNVSYDTNSATRIVVRDNGSISPNTNRG